MKLAIIGLGQLGGSLALAAKAQLDDVIIAGFDTDENHAQHIYEQGGLDEVCSNAAQAVKDADMVFLACPLTAYQPLIQEIAPHLKSDALLSDVGSVQNVLHQHSSSYPEITVIPSHPITGREHAGPTAAFENLFQDKLVLITPENPETSNATQLISFWKALGANDVLMLPASLHDVIYAHVSHLPHMVAFAAASTLHQHHAHLTAQDDMLKQFLRIAHSNPRIWTDIACENHEALSLALANCRSVLEHMANELNAAENKDQANTLSATEIAKTYLPQLAASAVVTCVSMLEMQHQLSLKKFSGTGLQGVSAPATQMPETALETISNHALQLAPVLTDYVDRLKQLESYIQQKEHAALHSLIETMRQSAEAISQPTH